MRLAQQSGSAALAAAFWLASVWLVEGSGLLRPYYEYHHPKLTLAVVCLHALVCAGYGLAQGALLRVDAARAVAGGLVCGVLTLLALLFFKLEPVMFAELVGNRMFYLYFSGVSAAAAVAFTLASGHILRGAARPAERPAVPLTTYLPLALVGFYPHTRFLLPSAACALLLAAVGRASARRRVARALAPLGTRARRAAALWRDERVFVAALFAVAFLLRAGYAVRTALKETSEGFVWDDAVVYEQGAFDFSYEGYSLFLRAIYGLFGHSFVAVGVVQALVGALTCVLVYRVAKSILGERVARLAALFSVVEGTQLFMPAMHARETLLTFGLMLVIYLSIRLSDGPRLSRDLLLGLVIGLAALVKVILFPVIAPVAYYRWRAGLALPRGLLAMLLVAGAVLATKPLVNRPLDVPVGRSTTEYAALAYFAGNHPFSREEEWFNLTPGQYGELRALGFNVGAGAGDPATVAAWKERHPRIAYCDKVTFETNTWNLIRYNAARPARMAESHFNNLVAFFLGVFRHHRVFDPVYQLNKSAFSMALRAYCLLLFAFGLVASRRTAAGDHLRRARLTLVGLVVGYFALVHTLIIGTTIYSIPIVPFVLMAQCSGLLILYASARGLSPAALFSAPRQVNPEGAEDGRGKDADAASGWLPQHTLSRG